MLMSVNWGSIHATPMPTALTQVEASAVHAWKALMGMDLTAQVVLFHMLKLWLSEDMICTDISTW